MEEFKNESMKRFPSISYNYNNGNMISQMRLSSVSNPVSHLKDNTHMSLGYINEIMK